MRLAGVRCAGPLSSPIAAGLPGADLGEAVPPISAKALSGALAALGTYAEPPTDAQLAAAERAEGRAGLAARLANALYGSALAHVMTAEVAAQEAGEGGGYRAEAWRAAGAAGEGTAILLHYTAMRLASEVRGISDRLPADLGVMGAAAGAANALKLLLEVCTVRSMDDPRAAAVTANLARASDQLATAAERIDTLFAAAAAQIWQRVPGGMPLTLASTSVPGAAACSAPPRGPRWPR